MYERQLCCRSSNMFFERVVLNADEVSIQYNTFRVDSNVYHVGTETCLKIMFRNCFMLNTLIMFFVKQKATNIFFFENN